METGLPEDPRTLQMQVSPTQETINELMSSKAPEYQKGAQMMERRGNPAVGAKTQILPVYKPTSP
jgi:hypothetical protein